MEREVSQNERYRDYSPGDVQIQTPSAPFPGLNLRHVHNMFDLNDRVLNNRFNEMDISHKYRIDNKLKESKKNTYHLKHKQGSDRSYVGQDPSRRMRHPRKIDTSNYTVKSINNSRGVASKHK